MSWSPDFDLATAVAQRQLMRCHVVLSTVLAPQPGVYAALQAARKVVDGYAPRNAPHVAQIVDSRDAAWSERSSEIGKAFYVHAKPEFQNDAVGLGQILAGALEAMRGLVPISMDQSDLPEAEAAIEMLVALDGLFIAADLAICPLIKIPLTLRTAHQAAELMLRLKQKG